MEFNALKKTICVLLAISLILCPAVTSFAEQRPSAADIPISSIIIGSFLIDFSTLDSEIFTLALDSADSTGQKKVYYKSEFARGTWFDITDAQSMDAVIAGTGKAVSNSEIDGLVLTHWAKAKGIIIDLTTGKAVSINSIDTTLHRSYQDFRELDDLRAEQKIAEKKLEQEEDKDEPDDNLIDELKFSLRAMKEIFLPLTSQAYLDAVDIHDAMAAYIDHVRNGTLENKDELVEVLLLEKEQLKLKREIAAYREVKGRTDLYRDMAKEQEFISFSQKLIEASAALETALVELENQLESVPAGLFATEQWHLKPSLLSRIKARDFNGADPILYKIFIIGTISQGRIIKRQYELTVLNEIKPKVMKELLAKCDIIDSDKLKNAKAANEPATILKNLKEEELTEIKSLISDIKYLDDLILARLDTDNERMKLLRDDISTFSSQAAKMSQTLQADKIALLQTLINELYGELNKLLSAQDEQSNALQDQAARLAEDIKNLQEQYLGAIEKGDLELAAEIEGMMEELIARLQELQGEVLDEMALLKAQRDKLAGELARAVASGNLSRAEDLRQQISDIDVKIIGLQGLLDEETLKTFEAYENLKQQLSEYMENRDVNGVADTLSEMEGFLSTVSDQIGALLKDDDLMRRAADFLNSMLKTALANGDGEGAAQLNELLGMLEEVFGVAAGTLPEGAETPPEGIDEGLAEKVMLEMESLFSRLDAARTLLDQYPDGDEMRETVEGIIKGITDEIKSLEAQLYTPEEKKLLEERSKAISAMDGGRQVVPYMSIVGKDVFFKLYDPPVMKNGNILVGIRKVYEFFGARVEWENHSKKATVTANGDVIVIQVGNNNAYVNGNPVKMAAGAETIDSLTYAPLAFILETLGYNYEWIDEGAIAAIWSSTE